MSGPRLGKIKVSMRLLGKLLHLPEGCEVQAISQHFCDMRRGYFEVYLQGTGMPACADQDEIPHMRVKVCKQGVVEFEEAK